MKESKTVTIQTPNGLTFTYLLPDYQLHNMEGPAAISADGLQAKFYVNGVRLDFEEWCAVTHKTDDEIVEFKLLWPLTYFDIKKKESHELK